MKGLIMECIIFVGDGNRKKGSEKLNEIVSEKMKQGIELIERRKSSISDYAMFSDGELWNVLSANNNSRGHKWIKAYVDSEISVDMIRFLVEPLGIYKIEDYKIF